jgi:hypothetical protein
MKMNYDEQLSMTDGEFQQVTENQIKQFLSAYTV